MDKHRLKDIDSIQSYILGGRADFILNDIEIDNHINFQSRRDSKDKSIYFIKYKSIDWIYIGFIRTKEIKIDNEIYNIPFFYPIKEGVIYNKIKTTKEQIEKSNIFSNFIKYVYYIGIVPRNLEVLYSGICCKCGRKLTDPLCIEMGIGETCLRNSL